MAWTAKSTGEVDGVNGKWAEYTGSTIPEDWVQYFHPDDLPIAFEKWSASLATGEEFVHEVRVLRASDSAFRWQLLRALPQKDSTGKISRWLGLCTDIHEYKQTVEALRIARKEAEESEKMLRLVTDNLPTFVSYMDKDKRYRMVNKYYVDWFETSRESIEGRTRSEFANDPSGLEFLRPFEEKAFTGEPAHFEFSVSKASGEYLILDTHFVPDIDPATGEVRGIIRVGHDITERKIVEERYRSLTETLPQLIWTADPSGQVTYANERCLQYTGISSKEKFGEGWAASIHSDDLADIYATWKTCMITGLPFKKEYRIRRHDGAYRWFLGRSIPVRNKNNEISYWIGTATDIEDQMRSAREIEHAKELAEAANATKSAFLANMSHEIRTPLGVILGFTGLLKDAKLSPEDRDHYIDAINRNGQALTRIIDDILDLAKVEAGRLEVEEIHFSLFGLISEVVDLFNEKARQKGIYLFLNIDENVPHQIFSDPTRIRQILINIVGNAVKFTDNGGVRVHVRAEETLEQELMISIDVKDTGRGLSNDQRDRLFKPFSQADNTTTRQFGGTGLGLALSKRLAEALGGTIKIIEHQLGQGSVFNISFVATPSCPRVPQTEGSHKNKDLQDSILSGVKVLLVEDSPDNQFLIKRILTKNGAIVDVANDGLEAVENAIRCSHDVILMDIQMPRMDGYQATSTLIQKGYRKPILALTAHAMIEERAKTQAAGFSGHLTKPIDTAELIKAVHFHVLGKGINSSSSPKIG